MLLAGRVRKPEEEAIILSILEKHFKKKVKPEHLFSQKQVTSQFSKSLHFFIFYSMLNYLHFLNLKGMLVILNYFPTVSGFALMVLFDLA